MATIGVATVGVDGPAVAAPGAWRRGLDRITGVLPAVGTVAFALLAVATVIAPSGWGPRATSMCRGGYTVVALLAGAVVLALAQAGPTTWLFRALAVAPLAWLGRISYGFYLWHFPVVAHWGPGLTGALGRWPAILAAGLLSVVLAAASYYLVERPILRRCPRWSRPSPAGSGRLASAPRTGRGPRRRPSRSPPRR
ncbi:acyltransferase family protein, partial [Frankia canadensis]|uniref:acyltransferase family protein n=1 Tax=Frankia canadensis TaxID=1836972 RepID=UPI001FB02D38